MPSTSICELTRCNECAFAQWHRRCRCPAGTLCGAASGWRQVATGLFLCAMCACMCECKRCTFIWQVCSVVQRACACVSANALRLSGRYVWWCGVHVFVWVRKLYVYLPGMFGGATCMCLCECKRFTFIWQVCSVVQCACACVSANALNISGRYVRWCCTWWRAEDLHLIPVSSMLCSSFTWQACSVVLPVVKSKRRLVNPWLMCACVLT